MRISSDSFVAGNVSDFRPNCCLIVEYMPLYIVVKLVFVLNTLHCIMKMIIIIIICDTLQYNLFNKKLILLFVQRENIITDSSVSYN